MRVQIFLSGLLLVAGISVAAQAVVRTDKKPKFFMPQEETNTKVKSEATSGNRHAGTMVKAEEAFAAQMKIAVNPAPIDDILAEQKFSQNDLQKYKESVVQSYSMLPKDLNLILQNEYETINQETQRMREIKKHFSEMPEVYRYVNFRLPEQISLEMTEVRQAFIERKKSYTEFIEKAPKDKNVSIIISKNPLFMRMERGIFYGVWDDVTYVSLFDHSYKHIFTYVRKHSNMLENRNIAAAQTTSGRVNQIYQNLFDGYIYDLRRIGAGLDVTNPVLLRQIGEMNDDYVLMEE